MLAPIETAVARISMILGGLVLLAMMLQVVVDVFMRAFLGAGFPATADLLLLRFHQYRLARAWHLWQQMLC